MKARVTEADDGRLYVVCPDCGGPMSASALLCKNCFTRAGGCGAPIYRAAKARGESRSLPKRPADVPPRVYHKRLAAKV